jgi:hypothetical protein
MSSALHELRLPLLLMFDHRIQDSQEFPHAGRQGHFRQFPCTDQSVVKEFNWRIKARGGQGAPV